MKDRRGDFRLYYSQNAWIGIIPAIVAMNWCVLFISVFAFAFSLHTQVPSDEHWDVRFGPSGADGTILTVARHGSNVYVGGFFSMAGSANATNVARWDGTDWHPLGPGLGIADGSLVVAYVYSLATDGANLYAGGSFTNSGSLAITSSVVRWVLPDGQDGRTGRWESVGNLRGLPAHLSIHNGMLYAAGSLAIPGDTNTYGVARWDGSSWDTLGSKVSGCADLACYAGVANLVVVGSDIYVGGEFGSIGGVSANAVASFRTGTTQTGKWEAMGGGFTDPNGQVLVSGITAHNGQIYASGIFTNSGGVALQNMAVWNGSAWSPFGGGNDEVRRILSDGTHLYAVGDFTMIGGTSANRAARWSSQTGTWEPLAEGLTTGVFDAVLTDGELLASGSFVSAGKASVAGIARWGPSAQGQSEWSALNSGRQNGMNLPLGVVRAFDVFDGALYAGGDFIGANGRQQNRIARWSGTNWSGLGAGIIGPSAHRVRAISHVGNDLYAGGTFTNAGGVIASNVARWDGANWHALGSGVNSNVHAMADLGGQLLVGGAFTMAGGVTANRLAVWNGQSWFQSGNVNSNVNAIAIRPDGLPVIGGAFTMINGAPAYKVAEFTWGAGWHGLPAGAMSPAGNVTALVLMGDDLYVGGSFAMPNINATNIAKVTRSGGWSAVGGSVFGRTTTPINAMVVHGGELFVAGTLTNAGGVAVQAIAKWDGTNWHALGSGVDTTPGSPTVSALAVFQDSVYVGGLLRRAGERPSICIARWIPELPLRITGSSFSANRLRLQAATAPGLRLRLDATSDLGAWMPVQSLNSYSDAVEFIDEMPASDRRIYRVVAEP